jgi:hypothetical protein
MEKREKKRKDISRMVVRLLAKLRLFLLRDEASQDKKIKIAKTLAEAKSIPGAGLSAN